MVKRRPKTLDDKLNPRAVTTQSDRRTHQHAIGLVAQSQRSKLRDNTVSGPADIGEDLLARVTSSLGGKTLGRGYWNSTTGLR